MGLHTVTVQGPTQMSDDLEQMLDVLPNACLVGGHGQPATLWFDVRARTADVAIERAYVRLVHLLGDDAVVFEVVRAAAVEGRPRRWHWHPLAWR